MSGNILKLKLERTDFAVILDENRKKKEFIDVQLQIGDQLFDAHRNILSVYSPVLRAMLSDQWSTTKIFPISGEYVDPSIVEELLHFLYTGSIDLTPDNVHPVCVAAHFLQIATLFEPAVQHLCQLISVDNVLTLFEFSINSQLERLRDFCLQFIAKNNAIVFQDSRILEFSVENFKDLIDGLKEQLWDPRTELRVNTFDCIVCWAETDLSERLDQLPGLLKSIPLEELPHDFLTEVVSEHLLVKGSVSGMRTVSDALENYEKYTSRKKKNLIVFSRAQANRGNCCNSNLTIRTIRCYDWQTESWRALALNLLEPIHCFDCTVLNKRDIVVSDGCMWSVDMFDWASQTWKKLVTVPHSIVRTEDLLVAALNDHLYASYSDLNYLVKESKEQSCIVIHLKNNNGNV